MTDPIGIAGVFHSCRLHLEQRGLYATWTSDPKTISAKISEMDREVTLYLDPNVNEFTLDRIAWIFLHDDAGRVAASVASRVDRLGEESLASYFSRNLKVFHPEATETEDADGDRIPPIMRRIHGNVIYTGELFIRPDLRSTSVSTMRTLMLMSHCNSLVRWPDADWTYAFLRRRHGQAWAVQMHHYSSGYEWTLSWSEPPGAPGREHWLAVSTRQDIIALIEGYRNTPGRLAVI